MKPFYGDYVQFQTLIHHGATRSCKAFVKKAPHLFTEDEKSQFDFYEYIRRYDHDQHFITV